MIFHWLFLLYRSTVIFTLIFHTFSFHSLISFSTHWLSLYFFSFRRSFIQHTSSTFPFPAINFCTFWRSLKKSEHIQLFYIEEPREWHSTKANQEERTVFWPGNRGTIVYSSVQKLFSQCFWVKASARYSQCFPQN